MENSRLTNCPISSSVAVAESLPVDSLVVGSLQVDLLGAMPLRADSLSVQPLGVDSLMVESLRVDSLVVQPPEWEAQGSVLAPQVLPPLGTESLHTQLVVGMA